MTRLVIGRPAVGGMGANQKAKEAFSGAEFPLVVNVVNKMTITLSLPEAGIKLRPLASGVATFRDYDRLQRAVSSLEQIARLNNAAQLVILESAEPSAEEAKAAAEPVPGVMPAMPATATTAIALAVTAPSRRPRAGQKGWSPSCRTTSRRLSSSWMACASSRCATRCARTAR